MILTGSAAIYFSSASLLDCRHPAGILQPIHVETRLGWFESGDRRKVAVVITSNLRLADAPGNVRLPIKGTGLSMPSVANVSQILTIDKSFVTKRIGKLAPRLLADVEDGIRLVLSV